MKSIIPPHYLDLVADAALRSYWRKRSLAHFLRRCGVSESFLAGWSKDETKRDLLHRLFPRLEDAGDSGLQLVNRMTDALVQQESFPDLEGWEDSKKMIDDAKRAVASLKDYRNTQTKKTEAERDQTAARKRAAEISDEIRRKKLDLEKLTSRIEDLSKQLGTVAAGYAFKSGSTIFAITSR